MNASDSKNTQTGKETKALFQIDDWPPREAVIKATDPGNKGLIEILDLKANLIGGEHPIIQCIKSDTDHNQAHLNLGLFHALISWAISDGLTHVFKILSENSPILRGKIELVDEYTAKIVIGNLIFVVYSEEGQTEEPDLIELDEKTFPLIPALN